jgi:hypothetical protein
VRWGKRRSKVENGRDDDDDDDDDDDEEEEVARGTYVAF